MKRFRATPLNSSGITRPTIIGFCIPLVLALVIGIFVHHLVRPITMPENSDPTDSSVVTSTPTSTTPPTASEIAAANAAILAYCNNDLRQDTSCALVPNSNVTAPGFVVSGLKMNGTFEGTSPDGLALTRGSGASWSVIWVGQNCIPQDVATQYSVPASLSVCSS